MFKSFVLEIFSAWYDNIYTNIVKVELGLASHLTKNDLKKQHE